MPITNETARTMRRVVWLRKRGLTYREVASYLNISISYACNLWRAYSNAHAVPVRITPGRTPESIQRWWQERGY